MSTFRVRVIDGGAIVPPSALRRKHGFEVGKTLVVEDSSGSVTIRSLDDAVAAAQAIMAKIAPASRVLSDELVADRRAEAARD